MKKMKVFIAGPRAISTLNKKVKQRIDKIIENNLMILIGDANGIDKEVQHYLYASRYKQVKVFASNGKVRNNVGNWEVENVNVNSNVKGFDFYAAKDKAMAKSTDYGFMIWNGKSRGTLNNIYNLINFGKTVLVYYTPDKSFYTLTKLSDVNSLINSNGNRLIHEDKPVEDSAQLTLF